MSAVADVSLKATLDEMTRRLVAEFGPSQIYLFGSHAWGRPNEDSDVDLMVVVPNSDERPSERGLRALNCLDGVRIAKDVLVYTQAEVDWDSRVYATLVSEILEKGVKLYG